MLVFYALRTLDYTAPNVHRRNVGLFAPRAIEFIKPTRNHQKLLAALGRMRGLANGRMGSPEIARTSSTRH